MSEAPIMIWSRKRQACQDSASFAGTQQLFRRQTQTAKPMNLAGGSRGRAGQGEPVRSLAHSRASAFGPATFPALLGLATRPHPRRTEGVPGLGSRCGPSAGSAYASQTASVRSNERNSARCSGRGRCVREQCAARESRLRRHSPCRIFGSAFSCVQRKV